MMRKLLLLVFLIAVLLLQGCLTPPPYGCIENPYETPSLGGTNDYTNPDFPYYCTKDPYSGENWVDCSNVDENGYCEVKCLLDNNNNEVIFDPPLQVPPCFDYSKLKGECSFGCSYLVCTGYEEPKKSKNSLLSVADAVEVKRKFGTRRDSLSSLSTLIKDRLIITPMNLFHSKCEFRQLDGETYKDLEEKNALFLTFRLGAGRNFDEFDFISNVLPPSSSICGLNPNGGVERYAMYLTPSMLNGDYACESYVEGGKKYWRIKESIFTALGNTQGNRINKFTTFADCMLNANYYYMLSAEDPGPFVPESFCYSSDYLYKPLPYLFGADLYKKDRFVGLFYPNVNENTHQFLKNNYNIESLEDDREDLTFASEENLYPERYNDFYLDINSNSYDFKKIENPITKKTYLKNFKDVNDNDITEYSIDFLKEGVLYKEAYFDKLPTINVYYEQFKYGSLDKQGRKKGGAEYECSSGQECISGFCSLDSYMRTSCTAVDNNGNTYEEACSCTINDCNFFDQGTYKLNDGREVKKYFTREDTYSKKPKVYVIKPHNQWRSQDEGWNNFFYRVHVGSVVSYHTEEEDADFSNNEGSAFFSAYGLGSSQEEEARACVKDAESNKWVCPVDGSKKCYSSKNPGDKDICGVEDTVCYCFDFGSNFVGIELRVVDRLVGVICDGSSDLYSCYPSETIPRLRTPKVEEDYTVNIYSTRDPNTPLKENGMRFSPLVLFNSPSGSSPALKLSTLNDDSGGTPVKDAGFFEANIYGNREGKGDYASSNYRPLSLSETESFIKISGLEKNNDKFTRKETSLKCAYNIRALGTINTGDNSEKPLNAGIIANDLSNSLILGEYWGLNKDTFGIPWEFSEDVKSRYGDKLNIIDEYASGPFLKALEIGQEPVPASSQTFFRVEEGYLGQIKEYMYIVNYVTNSPESIEKVYSEKPKKDMLIIGYDKERDYLAKENGLITYADFKEDRPALLDLDLKFAILGFMDNNDALFKRNDLPVGDISGGKMCLNLHDPNILVIPRGSTDKQYSYKKRIDFHLRGIKALPQDPSLNYNVDASFLQWFVGNKISKDDFGVYNTCYKNSNIPGDRIEGKFCINPYIMKYKNGEYQGDSLYVFEDFYGQDGFYSGCNPDDLSGFERASCIFFKTLDLNRGFCDKIPPKFFCLGTWTGDEFNGKCNGDMAVSAFIFKDVIDNDPSTPELDDGKFGKCIVNKDSFTGLNISQFGICESCGVFNLAVERVEGNLKKNENEEYKLGSDSSNYEEDKYPLVLTDGFSDDTPNGIPNEYIDEVGFIKGASKRESCRSEKFPEEISLFYGINGKWWSPYAYSSESGGNQDNIGDIYYDSIYSKYPPEFYFMDRETRISKYESSVSFPGKYLFYPNDNLYSEFVNNAVYSNFNIDRDNIIFRGVYTAKPPVDTDDCPPYGYNSSFYSTPDDFYPTKSYLVEKIRGYLKRGILPLIYLKDDSLYNPGSIPYFDDGIPDSYDEREFSSFVSKVLRDIQYIERDPKNETGFKKNLSIPIGTAAIVVGSYDVKMLNNVINVETETPQTTYDKRIEIVKKDCSTCLTAISFVMKEGFVFALPSNEITGEISNENIDTFIDLLYNNPQDDLRGSDFIVYEVYLDIRGLSEENVKQFIDELIYLSSKSSSELSKPSLFYIRDIKYNSNYELDLLFSYLNYRKSDIVSSGAIGIHFEDVRKTQDLPPSGENSLYVFDKLGSVNYVGEGYCQITRNILPLGGLITLRSTNPILLDDSCDKYDCIETPQCVDPSETPIQCTVRKGDGTQVTFTITEYSEEMSDFIGLSLSQNGFTLCPRDENKNIITPSQVYKTLPVPSQYVVPITYGTPSIYDPTSGSERQALCYPTQVTPQELQEIFTEGIKFATCYPVNK